MKHYILYNPLAGHGSCQDMLAKLKTHISGDCVECDVTKFNGYGDIIAKLNDDDKIILCGGDGTLNKFVNGVAVEEIKNDILYYACGSGNDFLNDIGKKADEAPFKINKYLVDLPSVTVKGKKYRFINGVGYGIDGYCCEVGDQLKAESKKVDYTAIAIKGLLFHYKPCNASVVVDGKTHEFKKVWIAPTMNGRCYGGGMMPTPEQDRLNNEKVSLMVFHGTSAIKTLLIFPKLFKGEHVKHTKHVSIFTGKNIKVSFDKPCALQIDGETVLDVSSYTVHANSKN